jgi:hypothetical protein
MDVFQFLERYCEEEWAEQRSHRTRTRFSARFCVLRTFK